MSYAKTRALDLDVLYYDETERVYINPIVQSIAWSGDTQKAARKLEVTVSNTKDGESRLFSFECGREIAFFENGVELFRGVLFEVSTDYKGKTVLTAYDEAIYLTKNKDTVKLSKQTASSFIKSLCTKYQVPAGNIVDTKYVIPKMILRDKTVWDMMVTALTETKKHTNRRYMLTSRGGRLHLKERKDNPMQWLLENGVNIIKASYSQSIEDLRNKVKVVGETESKKEIIAEVKNDALIKKYGLMQHYETTSTKKTESEIKQLAKELLADLGKISDEAKLTCLGFSECTAGSAVYVVEKMTGIVGGFYVTADTHKFEGGKHTMDVTLSATDDLPELEYEPPQENTDTTKKKTTSKASSDGTKKKKKAKETKKKTSYKVDLKPRG